MIAVLLVVNVALLLALLVVLVRRHPHDSIAEQHDVVAQAQATFDAIVATKDFVASPERQRETNGRH